MYFLLGALIFSWVVMARGSEREWEEEDDGYVSCYGSDEQSEEQQSDDDDTDEKQGSMPEAGKEES